MDIWTGPDKDIVPLGHDQFELTSFNKCMMYVMMDRT